jgi:hypothetical protein
VAEYILLSYQVWSWSVEKYSKNKVFVSIITWPNFYLDLWPWPLLFSVMITSSRYLYMITMIIFLWKKGNRDFGKENQFLRYDVTKWPHNVKLFVDLESTYQGLSYEVQHHVVPYGTFDFKIWPWGKQISTRSETHEGQGWSAPKTNQLSTRPFATCTPSLELIW